MIPSNPYPGMLTGLFLLEDSPYVYSVHIFSIRCGEKSAFLSVDGASERAREAEANKRVRKLFRGRRRNRARRSFSVKGGSLKLLYRSSLYQHGTSYDLTYLSPSGSLIKPPLSEPSSQTTLLGLPTQIRSLEMILLITRPR